MVEGEEEEDAGWLVESETTMMMMNQKKMRFFSVAPGKVPRLFNGQGGWEGGEDGDARSTSCLNGVCTADKISSFPSLAYH